MEFPEIWVMRGPSIWGRTSVMEVEVDLGDSPPSLASSTGFVDRLLTALPPSDLQQVPSILTLPQALQYTLLRLQQLIGCDVSFSLTREESPRFSRVVVEYEEEAVGRAALQQARALCLALLNQREYPLTERLEELRRLAYDIRLGPSTAAIVKAARRRNIPARRLNEGSLVLLGYGARQRRICTAETDRTGVIAETIAQDKQLTRSLLRAVGVPVPDGRPVSSAEHAWETAEDLGLPVVVKPQFGNHGRGVATNLSTREQVLAAYEAARQESEQILVETYAPGDDYRLLVIGERLVAAARREPAQVLGDGRSTIRELIAEVNRDPRRSDGHSTVLSFIKLDPVALGVLGEQGLTPDSVPENGQKVLIRRNGNLSTGGTATDVTEDIHPEVAARAIEAARVIGLDIAGVDVVCLDPRKPLEEQKGAIVEVNAGPGLRMHLEPSAGKPRPVGEAIVDLLYPRGAGGRIPIIGVTGVNGKTTTTRLISHLLREAGRFVGMSCTDGLFLNGRRIEKGDYSGPRGARTVLINPRVEVAALETARYGILREGLGFDQCDVAVVTNIGGGDHLGRRGIETPEQLARVKRVVVENVGQGGLAVLNASDPLVRAMSEHCPGRIVYFSQDPANPVMAEHRQSGGWAVFVRDGAIYLADGHREELLVELDLVPVTHHGHVAFQVENVLAATAAAWCVGLPQSIIRAGLESFTGDLAQAPGRFNLLQGQGATIIVDYAHNATALAALVNALDHFPHHRRSIVFSGINRRDIDVLEMGEIIGRAFDHVYLYQDRDNENRADGELNALLRRGMQGGRVADIRELPFEGEAIDTAFSELRPNDLLIVGVEKIEQALERVKRHLGLNDRVRQTL